MGWTWRFETRGGDPVPAAAGDAGGAGDGGPAGGEGAPTGPYAGPPGGFPTQSDAETWLGESWRSLLDAGVDQVTLVEDGRDVYGPMSLHPVE